MISLYLKKIKKNIQVSINQLTLDPACGSGAFNRYVEYFNESCKATKYQSINSMGLKKLLEMYFGVDIEPTAIEVTKLRALLSLLVEEEFK